MSKTYSFDVLALDNWKSYFINKAFNKVLRNLNWEDIQHVSIQMTGNVTDFRVEETMERGGFLYALSDSTIKGTLVVYVALASKKVLSHVIDVSFPLRTERKRSADALSAQIREELKRFREAFEQAGQHIYTFQGKPSTLADSGLKVYFGASGFELFQKAINQHTEKITAESLITMYVKQTLENERGVRIADRFREEKVLKKLAYPNWKVIQGVPVFKFDSKQLTVYVAPTFAIVTKADQLMTLYNLDKGSSTHDVSLVLKKLHIPNLDYLLQVIDLRKNY